MSASLFQPPAGISLDSVLCTTELSGRPAHEPDYQKESRYLCELSTHLAEKPESILTRLTEIVMEGLGAGSAGVSLLNEDSSEFYWPAIAGAWVEHIGSGTPRNFGPCGIVLDRNAVQLFRSPEKYYPYLQPATPAINEVLLAPFYVHGVAVGTVWAVSHDFSRKFNTEDSRLLQSISKFAAAAYQTLVNLKHLKSQAVLVEEAQSRIESTLEASDIGTWLWDVKHNRVFADKNLAAMFSVLEDPKGAPLETFIAAIHPQDRDRVKAEIELALNSDVGFESDYRLLNGSNFIRWVSARGRVHRDASGEAVRFPGVVIDITARKKAEEKSAKIASDNLKLLNQL